MYEGAEEFFNWCDREDAYCEITYMPACGEVEIKISILGEGDFYRKRAGNYKMFLEAARKHYGREATSICIDCGANTKPGKGAARCPSCWEDRCGNQR